MKRNGREVSFWDSLWSHYREVPAGAEYDWYTRERTQLSRYEEHWGDRNNCPKCRQTGLVGDFYNMPTQKGLLFVVVVFALLALGAWVAIHMVG